MKPAAAKTAPLPPMQALIARARLVLLAEEIRRDILRKVQQPRQFDYSGGGQ